MNLWRLFLIFLRFGFLAWGGPVAQINMIREELVEQKKWLDKDKFKRVLAVYQALPGPEAHEICVYFGMMKAGRAGAIVAGLGFMLPGFLLMLLLSYLYVLFGSSILLCFVGVAPAVAALIIRATHRIADHVLHGQSLFIAAVVSVALTFLHVHFFLIFIICALWQVLWTKNHRKSAISLLVASLIFSAFFFFLKQNLIVEVVSLGQEKNLFFEGLKAGLLSFGGAYTVIPFLKDGMMNVYASITPQVFYDGIALSAVIPAPLVIFATYLGFIANGLQGALLMTAGIFLPAFAFTIFGHKQLEKLIENKSLHGILDGIAAALVGILAVTAFDIFVNSVLMTSPKNIIIFTAALFALYALKKKWTMPAVVVTSALAGLI